MLTRSGLGATVAALVLLTLGLWWRYEELVVVAAGTVVVVAASVWGARRPFRVQVDRRLGTVRVARGDPLHVVYRVRNDTRHRAAPATIVDRLMRAQPDLSGVSVPDPGTHAPEMARALSGDDRGVAVWAHTPVTAVDPDRAVDVAASFPTSRRGQYHVGPWVLERPDPLGLAVGRRAPEHPASTVVPVIVHPRIHDLVGPGGTMHTVESEAVIRRAATDPLSGFVAMREYVDGDDPRLIHWPTTARTGTLMVREHVELRRPELTVVLDAAAHVGSVDDFEEAVDAAASVAVHSLRHGLDVVVRTTSRRHPGSPRPARTDGPVLELLTHVEQVSDHHLATVAELFRTGLEHAAVVVVTGPAGPSSRFATLDQMIVVRIGAGATLAPGIALAADTAAAFARRWRPWA